MKRLSMTQKYTLYLLAIISICFLGLAVKEYYGGGLEVFSRDSGLIISHDSGFYDESFVLQISGNRVEEVYYTTDGTMPSKDNLAAQVYRDGIDIICQQTENVYTIRMIAYFTNGTVSEVINRTFITGTNVNERYDVPVLVLSSADETFFDTETGIITSDYRYERGPESEREIYMTLFDEKGNVNLSQGCGIRIYGAYSRRKNQPSFKLYARSEYDEQNDFKYAFFTNQYSEDNAVITDFKRIVVRNSGNDNGYAFIRSELVTRLCLDAGYPDVPCASPVAVYFNNTYYGAYWFVTNFDESYFKQTYGEYEGNMYVLEGAINELAVGEEETDEILIGLVNDYNKKISFFTAADLTAEENWTALNEYMDVENFLQYVAIHNFISNTDSLRNNYKIYRYVAPEGGSYTEDSVFDGRYRFLLYDLDYATITDGTFSGMYYKEVPVTVTVRAKPGERFEYWIINGEKYEEDTFEITSDMIRADGVLLECICAEDSEAELCITAFKAKGGSDYIELTNLGQEAKNLRDYFLSDSDVWNKSTLPGIEVEAGESIIIYCKNYAGAEALGQPCVNFNIKAGETLSLYRKGEQLQVVEIPQLGLENGIYTMDRNTGEFCEMFQRE